ncbi:MAG: hypothetical protein J5802_01025 [Butyrivibrio sp.]|nr:hypothetical protein [Butyrivibrio sp.]
MKKRIISTLFCLCIGVCTMGCSLLDDEPVTEVVTEDYDFDANSNETTGSSETAEEESVSVATEAPEDESASTAPTGDITEETDDGVFDAVLQANEKDNAGLADENGVLRCIVYNTSLTEDTLYLEGVCGYRNVIQQDRLSVLDDTIHAFKIDSNTVFDMMGSSEGSDSIPVDVFRKNLVSCANSGMQIFVTVADGVATKVEIRAE